LGWAHCRPRSRATWGLVQMLDGFAVHRNSSRMIKNAVSSSLDSESLIGGNSARSRSAVIALIRRLRQAYSTIPIEVFERRERRHAGGRAVGEFGQECWPDTIFVSEPFGSSRLRDAIARRLDHSDGFSKRQGGLRFVLRALGTARFAFYFG